MKITRLRKIYLVLAILTLGLIALGGAVRAMNAGLACPDWPLCFGQLIPDFHPQVYFEFIHRVVAGLIALISLFVGVAALRSPAVPSRAKKLIWAAWIVLIVQIVMGGLTVLKLLHFGTVTAHLALGMIFFSIIVWILFVLSKPEWTSLQRRKTPLKYLIHLSPILIFAQILLGGLVSSNYAGLACTDFPLCQGQLIPTLEGVVGLHVMHRLGAYAVFLFFYLLYLGIKFKGQALSLAVTKAARMALSLVMLQVMVGMANVIFKIPPIITVIHLAIAAAILATSLRMVFLLSYEPSQSQST